MLDLRERNGTSHPREIDMLPTNSLVNHSTTFNTELVDILLPSYCQLNTPTSGCRNISIKSIPAHSALGAPDYLPPYACL